MIFLLFPRSDVLDTISPWEYQSFSHSSKNPRTIPNDPFLKEYNAIIINMRVKMNGNLIFLIGLGLLVFGTGVMNVGTYLRSKEEIKRQKTTINELNNQLLTLNKGNQELIEGKNKLLIQNQELTNKIEKYQEDLKEKQKMIDELEIKSKKAERGITSIYEFNGTKRETIRPGHINMNIGQEVEIFKKIDNLEKEKRYPELILICENQIKKTPNWLTPYLFLGVAYANTGNKIKAIELFKYVIKNTPDDPDYKQAEDFLKRLNN
jgi:tetratricopeptide (TPR) repeat protein